MFKKILISFFIYTIFFCNLGGTCYRINSNGIYIFSLLPLFTEGLFGPIRTLYLLFSYGFYRELFLTLVNDLFSLHNFFGALLFVMYIEFMYNKNIKLN
jgi:hypothetical protein